MQMDSLQLELDRLNQENAQYKEELESLREFKSSHQAVIEAKDVKIAEQKELITSLIKNNEALTKSVELLGEMKKENGNMDMLQSDLERLNLENAKHKKELSSMAVTMKVALAAQKNKIGELEVELRESKNVIETKDAKIAEQEKLISSLANKNEITETTIRARFSEISKLTDSRVHSRPIIFAGIDWRICIYKNDDDLAVRLNTKMKSTGSMVCAGFSEFQLISHNSNDIYYSRPHDKKADVYRDDGNWGYPKFISFKDLFDEKTGYVKDDSILVAVSIKVFPTV